MKEYLIIQPVFEKVMELGCVCQGKTINFFNKKSLGFLPRLSVIIKMY